MPKYIIYIAIPFLVVLAVLLGPPILVGYGILRCYGWCRERIRLAQLRPRAISALSSVQATPLPEPLTTPPPRELIWRGGYLAGGEKTEIPRYKHLLQNGVPTQAVIIHYWARTGSGEHDSAFYYVFKDLKGRMRIEKEEASVDARGAAVARGSGRPVPTMDLDLGIGSVLTVLLDPLSDDHLIYESLLVFTLKDLWAGSTLETKPR